MARLVLACLAFVSCVFAQNPPRELVAESNLDGRVELWWRSPVVPLEVTELAYDDGSGGGADEADAGDILSVRFTPTQPCSLIAVKFYGYTLFPHITVQINVYPDNGYGKPNVLSPLLAYPVEWEIESGWQEVDLSLSGLTFDAYEDFHIGIKKTVSPDSFYHCILTDGETGAEERSWWYDHSLFAFRHLDGDLEIRALVVYSSAGARRELPTEKTVVPSAELVGRRTLRFAALDVEDYIVYRTTTPGDTLSMIPIATTTDTYFTDETVTNDRTYYYAVKAHYAGGGLSGFSNVASATPRSGGAALVLDTISVTDDVGEACASWSPGRGFATLIPADRVGLLRSLEFWVCSPGNFRPQIWSVIDGAPQDILLNWPTQLSATTTGWRNVSVSSWTTFVVDGPLVAACIAGDTYFGIAMDVPGYGSSFDFDGTSWSSVVDSTYMIRAIIEYYEDRAYFHIRRGWNLVSVPLVLDDPSVAAVFPTAIGGIAYKFNPITLSYDVVTALEPGVGYWIASNVDTMYVVGGGIPVRSMDVRVYGGWNLVGAPSKAGGYSVFDIETYPSGIIGVTPYLYTYDPEAGSFERRTVLQPGKGYFILCGEAGYLRFAP